MSLVAGAADVFSGGYFFDRPGGPRRCRDRGDVRGSSRQRAAEPLSTHDDVVGGRRIEDLACAALLFRRGPPDDGHALPAQRARHRRQLVRAVCDTTVRARSIAA
jgi:hypothetical protein